MIVSRIPRVLLYATTLGIVVAAIMLSMFYGQYRWLANQIVSVSYEEHRSLAEASYERRVRSTLHGIAKALPDDVGAGNDAMLNRALNRALSENLSINGLRLTLDSGRSWASGNIPQAHGIEEAIWLGEQLLLSYPVVRERGEIGRLWGSFARAPLQAELDSFASELQAKEQESRRISYLWIGGGTIAMLLLCGAVVWVIGRNQTRRIRQLKAQAERFSDADFGEPLPATGGDELGALAAVFNEMRDKLRRTTHSRDYVDSILSGMNEAIIVTTDDGQIERINTATTHLLGY
ncbi:MAG: HAMP domain-containing protein, partial [Proteobacteria bacterium]|nr:HAMP domain-containing protein [Pseudomonadota bacterium]